MIAVEIAPSPTDSSLRFLMSKLRKSYEHPVWSSGCKICQPKIWTKIAILKRIAKIPNINWK